MQRYTKTLIEEETNLTIMVEKALREIEKEDTETDNSLDLDIVDDVEVNLDDLEKEIGYSDYEEFEEFIESEAMSDLYLLEGDDE
jgi:hypothetical protein